MHVVAICNWKEGAAELVSALAGALGITAYEARLRMFGIGPAVVASFADQQPAQALAGKLEQSGIPTLVVDATAIRDSSGYFIVRRFEFNKWSVSIETSAGQQRIEIPYDDIDLLLPCTSIIGVSTQKTVTERKFSIGKTMLSGGLPMTTKVERQETVTDEERTMVLYLYAGTRAPIIFSQVGMTFDGLGAAMQLSRELNFTHLTNELRRLCPAAVHDDRLVSQMGQIRLLGPGLNPENNLNLAVEVLALSLRQRGA